MRPSSLFLRCALLAAALGLLIPVSALSQTFSANTGAEAVIHTAPLDESTTLRPGRHREADRELLFGRVREGAYTVDGLVAKVQLNYDIAGVRSLFLFVPGVGTAVVSAQAEPEEKTSPATLESNDLVLLVAGRTLKLSGIALSNGKGVTLHRLYARLDSTAWNLGRHPMVGFGDATAAPYAWPGALQTARPEAASVLAPPVPVSLLPSSTPVVPGARPRTVTLQAVSLKR